MTNHRRRRSALAAAAGLICVSGTSALATKVTQLTHGPGGQLETTATLDAFGQNVFVNAGGDPYGTNPSYTAQVFRFDAETGDGEQLTFFAEGVSKAPYGVSASDSGEWVAFISRSDPVGSNHDQSPEVFVMRSDGTLLAQLTSDPLPNAGSATRLVLSGSADRVVFLSTSDLLGENPQRRVQLYVVGRDGTGLDQLTQSTGSELDTIDISDDGSRIVFSYGGNPLGTNTEGNPEIFAIQANGSNLRQLTTAPSGSSRNVSISGDGALVVFDSDATVVAPAVGTPRIHTVRWDGTSLTRYDGSLGSQARFPAVTDDAQFVYFLADHNPSGGSNPDGSIELWRMAAASSQLTQVTSDGFTFLLFEPVAVSANGARVALTRQNLPTGGISIGADLHTLDFFGGSLVQITDTAPINIDSPAVSGDGSRIVFSSRNDLTGQPGGLGNLFRVASNGSGLVQLTGDYGDSIPYTLSDTVVSADGSTVAFACNTNATGQNADGQSEIFRIQSDGTGLDQLTVSPGFSAFPAISANGSKVAFTSNGDFFNVNPPNVVSLYCMSSDGTGLAQLTSSSISVFSRPRIDETGFWVVFTSRANLVGTNADGSSEVFRVRCSSGALHQITSDPSRDSLFVDVSGSGNRIVYSSRANPLGTNPENNPEIFLRDMSAGTLQQLTSTPSAQALVPRISQDGAVVYFVSDQQVAESDPDSRRDVFRVVVASGTVERVGGIALGDAVLEDDVLAVDADGSRAAFTGEGDFADTNPDVSRDLWLVDLDTAADIRPGRPAPTVVRWDAESLPIRYDVIRGDVASLEAGTGATTDLGGVVCLDNDSPDTDTVGSEDMGQPTPGQAFFFLYRGSRGLAFGAGSYGQSSNGSTRVPAAGGCAP